MEDANILIISMVIYQPNCANFLLRPPGRNKPCRTVVKQLGILAWFRTALFGGGDTRFVCLFRVSRGVK